MFKKIKTAFIKLRLRFLAFRIRRRDLKAKHFEFRTKQLVNRYYFLKSLKQE
jgi:hypothetical protein